MSDGKIYCALTFDDGPNTTTTMHVLDVLERHNAAASFFLCGDRITPLTAPAVRRACDMGCEICNHSRTHSHFTELTPAEMRSEIEYTSAAIRSITGHEPRFFRPPYISVNDEVFSTVPLPMICGIDCKDWDPAVSAQQRFDAILAQIKPGAIILLHDFEENERTVEAVGQLIPALRAMGYEFVTVSELFEKYGVTPEAHKKPYSFADQTEQIP